MSQVTPKETKEFLEALFRNKLTEAERILNQLQEKYRADTRYLSALKGILNSYAGDDRDSLIYMLYTNERMWRERRKIAKFLTDLGELFGSRDRFFQAWSEVLNMLDKLPTPSKFTDVAKS
ncbi:MAG: hypothetical protein RMI49_00265 [Candidatus Caldarchaeum sp.]|nr:hypothetical protein [Candidatus Caldarchaeum sp.]